MEQRPVKYPLGTLSHIEAKSVGEPGNRTFNLLLDSAGPSLSVWLEKEQLFQLGIYLQEVWPTYAGHVMGQAELMFYIIIVFSP